MLQSEAFGADSADEESEDIEITMLRRRGGGGPGMSRGELAINTVNTTSARFQNQAFSNRVCKVAVSSKPAVCLIKPLLGVLPSLWTGGGGGRHGGREAGRERER